MANKYTKMKIDMVKLIGLYQSGMTQKEVAEEMGITQKVVCQRLQHENFKCRKAAPRNQKKYLNNNWKGDKASYAAFHYRMKALRGSPKKCEVCNTVDLKRTYDWANLTGKYDDPNDYKRMCRSCHWKYDRKHLNFKGAIGGRPSNGGDNQCLRKSFAC
jgi:hypothetical protein